MLDPRRPLRRHYKPRLPHMGLFRLNEDYSMDTVYPKKKGDGTKDFLGHTCAQVFVGSDSHFIFVVLMQAEKYGDDALRDFIRYVGCPRCLHSDRSKMQSGKKIAKIC